MNKKYGFFLILGVAFFSLLTCPATYATDTLPDSNNIDIQLDSVEGWSRKTHYGAGASLLASCKYEQIGILNFFPTVPYNDTTTTPCGYAFINGNSVGPLTMGDSNHFAYNYSFSSSGRSISYPNWNTDLINNLGHPSYHASSYVSISQSFSPSGTYHFSNYGGDTYTSPFADEEGFDFLVITLGNLGNDYFSGGFPPYLSTRASFDINHLPGNASHTADEIRKTINSGSYFGWVWTKDGQKTSTLYTPSCAEKISDVSVECTTDFGTVLPEGESFAPLTDYINQLSDNTFFLLVGLPRYTDASYTIHEFSFATPKSMADYGVEFTNLSHPEYYYGMPSLYSYPYSNAYGGSVPYNSLYTETYSVYNTTFFITPTTPEAYARSRSFYGQLLSAQQNLWRYANGLSTYSPNPGSSFWSGIFSLDSLVFPFRNFFSGFTAAQCVSIPTLAGMLNLPSDQQYCTWWASGTRAVLTPIFNVASMMLLFGFVIHWVRKDNTDTIKEKR